MKINITNKEAELLIYEITSQFRSIQYYGKSMEKKGEITFNNFEKFGKDDFNLKSAEITDYEFKCYFNILKKLKEAKNK